MKKGTTMKLSLPKIKKAPVRKVSPGREATGHVAFPGGNQAFRDPATMAAPDQAFSAAMASKGGIQPEPTSPPLPTVQG